MNSRVEEWWDDWGVFVIGAVLVGLVFAMGFMTGNVQEMEVRVNANLDRKPLVCPEVEVEVRDACEEYPCERCTPMM